MRLIVLDNGLGDDFGHHRHMAINIVADARRYGCEPTVLSRRTIEPDTAAAIGATPTFADGYYAGVGSDPFVAMAKIQQYLRDFQNSGIGVSAGDLLFLPTTSPLELYGVLYWATRRDYGLKFAFLFHNTEHPDIDELLHSYLLEASARLMAAFAPDRLWLAATTPALVALLERKLGCSLHLVPSRTWHQDRGPAVRKLDPRVRVGFLGGLRLKKGADRIPSLIQAMRVQHPDWQIVLQCDPQSAFAPEFARFVADPSVDLVTDALDDDALSALLLSLDVLICPYARDSYRLCGSGLLNLAAGFGVATVVPSDTTLADQLCGPARPLGAIYEGDTDQAIIDGVADVVSSRAAHAAERPAAAARWREQASGTAMMRDLLGWAGVSTVPSLTSAPVA